MGTNRPKILHNVTVYHLHVANEVVLHRGIPPVVRQIHIPTNVCILLSKSKMRELRTLYVIVDLSYK